ncbi:MAG: hypothetical protein DRJ10_10215 [Bacteroidetes bacterium]|nr:MAG: hypothetical protein DRJ10_10215 [Bacteroidota bacterium]RLD85254.1 MAG: hypothetical protein DRJ07_03445 [Bacteroidota bacterium]
MQSEYKISKHLNKRIEERQIKEKWIYETIEQSDKSMEIANDEYHYFKKIVEFANRCLKVVVNPINKIVVTAFFDRKMTKNDCK